MTFIHVVDVHILAQGAQHAETSDSKDNLLLKAGGPAPLVEPSGEKPEFVGVGVKVRVQQVERGPANLQLPGPEMDLLPAEVNRYNNLGPVGAAHQLDRVLGGVDGRVLVLLPALRVEVLLEVAVSQKEADPYERKANV